jgi:putative protein-disulfide isomerase
VTMSPEILHYIHDPLCGWCYGAAPLVRAARKLLPVVAHGGGMMSGTRRQKVTPQLREYVMAHDRRIAAMTGQEFGERYFDGLLRDTASVFDSDPPIAAVLAADRVAGRGLDMLARLQTAHYVEGRRISDRAVHLDQAELIGLDRADFERALAEVEGPRVQAHIADTRKLMARLGAQGFPSFALEMDGRLRRVEIEPFMGQPDRFAQWLRDQVPGAAAALTATPDLKCGPGSCAT